MRRKKLGTYGIFLVLIAGFFQLITLSLDQFVIQLEEKNRIIEEKISRIEKQKGHHLVIEAINKSKHKTQLCIIGHCMNEKYKNELKDISSNYDMSNLISFTGFLESPMSYMPFFDLIILPTYEETFGLIVAEAMLMKVPVIGSNAGGVPEIITHKSNGLLFHSKNYNDLQEKIDIIIEDLELREKITANGFKFANKHYDYLSHFNKFEELINTH